MVPEKREEREKRGGTEIADERGGHRLEIFITPQLGRKRSGFLEREGKEERNFPKKNGRNGKKRERGGEKSAAVFIDLPVGF